MTWVLLLLQTSLRNIFSSFLNVVIGLIILVGTLFFVVGGSLVDSMDKAMSRSIIGSVAGNAQVYQATSADSPALFESWQIPDLDPIPDFSKIKGPLMSDPNVAAVVPEGINTAIVVYGNTIDQILEKLRKAVSPGTRQPKETVESLKAHVRQMVLDIQIDMTKVDKVASKGAVDPQAYDDLRKASSDAFWNSFDRDPFNHLEFLENKIAYLVPDSDQIFLSYVGTDLDAFTKSFDRMQIVDGQAIPPGHRGMLLSKYVYEEMFKLKSAHRMDQIHEGLTEKNKKIAKDPDLQDLVKQNRLQTREIVLQLDPLSSQKAVSILQNTLGTKETDLPKLLASFFDTDDANFEARYKIFYDQLAPLVELYRLKPGELLTIKAYTKSGSVEAVNVKVYGTFQFKGLEKSGLAGGLSLMDLMSFRDLYGYVTPEKMAETQTLEKAAGVKYVARDKAEADLFGDSSSDVEQGQQKVIDEKAEMGGGAKVKRVDLTTQVYTPEEIEKGVVMGAAIILKDPSKLKQTMKNLQDISDKQGLGLKVIDWQKAAGNLGQFVFVAKFILYFATFIIFVVALVIINNAVVMATLQRVREIGTMRAIGAPRGFVLSMVLTETMVLGLVFGTAGVTLGSLFMVWLGHAGIPAGNEFLYFFFSGPRLFPALSFGSLVGAFIVVLIVTCLSALYPALMATRVSPIQAMASDE
ncbi:MAG TPA: FtsX-like permease family protein [bacterium]|nr:FtsX-like permease family protein [bacterium]